MIRIVSNLKQQNDRHSRINKTHAFLIADKNKDGKISGSEMNILQNIFWNRRGENDGYKL